MEAAFGHDIPAIDRVAPTLTGLAKVVAVAAITTVVSAVLTPAVGVIAQEIAGGGSITGDVLGSAAQAAGEGLKNLADPMNLTKKVVQKVVTKGKDLPGADR